MCLIAEPSGAVAAAAALAGRGLHAVGDHRRVAVLTGGNVDPSVLADVLSAGGAS
jgi:threonine dehydratase